MSHLFKESSIRRTAHIAVLVGLVVASTLLNVLQARKIGRLENNIIALKSEGQLAIGSSVPGIVARDLDGNSVARPRRKSILVRKPTEPDRPVEIVNVLTEASAAPPEFASDVLIRLAESSKVRDPAWKREMLQEAFRLAAKSDQKFKRTYAGAVMDTREGYLSLAMAQDLDALSLQSRSVAAMLKVDKARAREMFSEISPDLKIPTLACSDALIPDVGNFYQVMKLVAHETFSPAGFAKARFFGSSSDICKQ